MSESIEYKGYGIRLKDSGMYVIYHLEDGRSYDVEPTLEQAKKLIDHWKLPEEYRSLQKENKELKRRLLGAEYLLWDFSGALKRAIAGTPPDPGEEDRDDEAVLRKRIHALFPQPPDSDEPEEL